VDSCGGAVYIGPSKSVGGTGSWSVLIGSELDCSVATSEIYKYCKLYEYDYPIEEQDKVSNGLDEYEKIIRQKFMEINYELFHNHYSKNKRLLHLHCFLHNYFINGPDIELSNHDIEMYKLTIDSFVEKIDA
jgi:hypothetical protein